MSAPGFIFSSDPRTGASTPEELKRRRAMAEAMWARQSSQMPKDAAEGISLVGQALLHRIGMNNLAKEEAGAKEAKSSIWGALTGGSATAGAPAVPPAPGSATSTASSSAAPGDPGIFSSFIDTAKSGISNPYGLAALAATGQAESGYDPKNAYGSWSDPSQSGQAGTAGGILSWRADRLAGLQKFASDNGDDPNRPSPATQAKFFLQEDPALVASLNGAKSVEEAQSAINGAWKFAGYDQPGGEAARRLGLAQGYLPQFQGGAGGAQVASLDPSAGIGATGPAAGGDMPWLRYANQGATRSQPVSPELSGALGFLPELGVTAEVFSGGQPTAEEGGARTGSTRHDHGGAGDMRFFRDGRQLDWANEADRPVFEEIVRRGKAAGLTGFGAGDGYMGQGTMHVGFGKPGVWGAGGRGSNAPDWLRAAYEGGAPGAASSAPVQVASLDAADGMASAYAPGLSAGRGPQTASSAIMAALNPQASAAPAAPAGPMQASPVAAALANLPPAQTVGANPAPPAGAGLDPRTSPDARTEMLSGRFDGFSQNTAPASSATAAPGGIDQRLLMSVLANPMASDEQKQYAAGLLQQQMKQNAPMTPAERLAQERFTYEKEQDSRTNKSWQKLDDNTLFNPVTGETKDIASAGGADTFTGSSVEAQSLNGLIRSGAITKDQALQIGAGKTITDPSTGAIMFMTPQGIFSQASPQTPPQPVAPQDASPQPTAAPGAAPAVSQPVAPPAAPGNAGLIPITPGKDPNAKPTEQMVRDRKLYSIMAPELDIIDKTYGALSDPQNQVAGRLPTQIGTLVGSADFQRATGAINTVAQQYLYSVSGASAPAEEVNKLADAVTPRVGDDEATIADKLRRLKGLTEAVRQGIGPTAPDGPSSTPAAPPASTVTRRKFNPATGMIE